MVLEVICSLDHGLGKIRANRGCVHFHRGAGGGDLQLRVHGRGASRFDARWL